MSSAPEHTRDRRLASFIALIASLLIGSPPDALGQGSDRIQLIGDFVPGHDLGGGLDRIFEYVTDRLGVEIEERIGLTFDPPGSGDCRSRGSTMSLARLPDPSFPSRVIMVRADEDTSLDQILGVFAHELGHVAQQIAIEGGDTIQSIFLEGFATWAAGRYWLDWQGATSFESSVKAYLETGTYLPLHENDLFLDTITEEGVSRFGADCLRQRDIIYTEWAAFIEYLVQEFGSDRLYSLFQSPPIVEPAPYRRPNFPAVYGRSLQELETAWLEKLAVEG